MCRPTAQAKADSSPASSSGIDTATPKRHELTETQIRASTAGHGRDIMGSPGQWENFRLVADSKLWRNWRDPLAVCESV